MNIRKKIFDFISVNNEEKGEVKVYYDRVMMALILLSLFPLMLKKPSGHVIVMEKIITVIFLIDYALRLLTADFALDKGRLSFLIYPFTTLAIIDLLSLLPSFSYFHQSLRVLKIFRLFRSLRVFKVLRYSKNTQLLTTVLRKQREPLYLVAGLTLAYLVISALVMFTFEPDLFSHFLDALYWATITLTTIGYGDFYPQTDLGKILTMISAFWGIAIVALPAGIITAGYMDEIANKD